MSTATLNQLIPIAVGEIGSATVQTVNARQLHAFLEIASDFKNWIARRIDEYGFREGIDFRSFLTESTGGRPAKKYALAIDTAKELAMVEKNEKGRQARQYFIECERRALHAPINPASPVNLSRMELLQLAMQAETERQELETRLSLVEPKAAALDRIANTEGSLCLTEAAKALGVPRNKLIQWMLQNKWIFRRNGNLEAYQVRIEQGVMEERPITYTSKSTGEERTKLNPRILTKGLTKLLTVFSSELKEAA